MRCLASPKFFDTYMARKLTLDQAVGQQFLLSFIGKKEPPLELLDALRLNHIGGIVLFRHKNVGSLEEVRALTAALQYAAAKGGAPPLLIAADQEGGQLMAFGDGTPFPGNMALGAARSEKLTLRVGHALGREVAAVGVNVDFAPVCDVNNNPSNPVVGTRSFGEDPVMVGKMSAALIRGMQSAGVAATAKHFPGHGDTASDSHHGAPVVPHDVRRIREIELPPFRAAVKAGVHLMMTAHIVMPALNGKTDIPATLSKDILQGLLRRKLRFNGVVISDAMDMHAMEQGAGYIAETLAGMAAGLDLLIFNHELSRVTPACANVIQAAKRGLLSEQGIHDSAQRILALKNWLKRFKQPALSVVGCREHQALAHEVAQASITLVRDTARRLPIHLSSDKKVAVVVPRPEDLTPADTSSYVTPGLAAAARRYHPQIDEFFVAMNPTEAEVRSLREKLEGYDLVILG